MKRLEKTHGVKGRLLRGLLEDLILYERITTTTSRGKLVKRAFEKLIANLEAPPQGRRALRQYLFTINTTKKVMEVILPRFATQRLVVRVAKVGSRLGDGAKMSQVWLRDTNVQISKEKEEGPEHVKKSATR